MRKLGERLQKKHREFPLGRLKSWNKIPNHYERGGWGFTDIEAISNKWVGIFNAPAMIWDLINNRLENHPTVVGPEIPTFEVTQILALARSLGASAELCHETWNFFMDSEWRPSSSKLERLAVHYAKQDKPKHFWSRGL